MSLIRFPDPRHASPEGIVALGGNLNVDTLLAAYRQGIFPWPIEGLPLAWFCPEERGVLDFASLHVPRSLVKERRRTSLRFTIDTAFQAVITACAGVKRRREDGTWITPRIIRAYCELHARGHAHSVEAWEGNMLVGGVYGVDVDGAFAGESMFHLRPNASKLALLYLIEHLRERNLEWMDIQVITPHMDALGAMIITRDEFLERLVLARRCGLKLFDSQGIDQQGHTG